VRQRRGPRLRTRPVAKRAYSLPGGLRGEVPTCHGHVKLRVMGRHERRAALSRFRRESAGVLVTHLLDVAEPLDGHPLLKRAAAYWRNGIATRRPYCIACRASFDGEATPGAFLFATAADADTATDAGAASVSAVCSSCWRELSPAELEHVALRTMQKLLRGAAWER
jgi:hypothetical protein